MGSGKHQKREVTKSRTSTIFRVNNSEGTWTPPLLSEALEFLLPH